MKFVIYVGILIALALGIFNATKIDPNAPFAGNSSVAVIGVLACACVILLFLILQRSRKVAEKYKNRR